MAWHVKRASGGWQVSRLVVVQAVSTAQYVGVGDSDGAGAVTTLGLGAHDPRRLAEEWLAVDPDPEDRAEVRRLLDSDDHAELTERFGARLAFGTAGMRGAVGAGPMRMNRVLARVVAASVAERILRDCPAEPHVVIGRDARHRSRHIADDAARVLAARGVRVTKLAEPLPTPVLAFAVRHLRASAGMMVTASHNPRRDNGCKVYWRGGAQLAAPVDAEISDIIDRTELLPDEGLASDNHRLITVADDGLQLAYVEAAVGLLDPRGPRTARIAYTPLHGVGAQTFLRAASVAGFKAPAVVSEQAEPDPDFPTAAFPNPEEPGVLDRLISLASAVRADLALAHDPDADRLAAAVPDGLRWRLLTGDELGCLLAEHLLSRQPRLPPEPSQRLPSPSTSPPGPGHQPRPLSEPSQQPEAQASAGRRRLVISTVVSTRLLGKIAARHDAEWVETLTGFKWIMKARQERAASHDLVLAYEDALGYAAGDAVLDKDGITAALLVAEFVSELASQGRTIADMLDDLHLRHGVHATGQRSIRFESSAGAAAGGSLRQQAMAALREAPPIELGGRTVTGVVDLESGSAGFPPADVVILEAGDDRVAVRPSGTEPKLKVYAEAAEAVVVAEGGEHRDGFDQGDSPGSGRGSREALASARREARARVSAMLDDAVRAAAEPERLIRRRGAARRSGRPERKALAERPWHTEPDHKQVQLRRDEVLRLIVACTDLTTLSGDDTPGRVRALCAQALRPDPADATIGPVAAVCVYPSLVGLAAELLASSPVAVASAAGAFPSGLSPLAVRVADIRAAVRAGATEIDTVLNRSAFLSGRADEAAAELRALREAAGDARLKTILEVAELGSADAIADAAMLAIDAGADMIKTSTGKSHAGATPEAVLTMAEVIGDHAARTGRAVGIKVAGGLSTAAEAERYVFVVRSVLGDDWLVPDRLRFGASGLLNSVCASLADQHRS